MHVGRPVGRKDRLIDHKIKLCFCRTSCLYDFCGGSCGCCLTVHISFSLCCAWQWKEYVLIIICYLIFISVNCNTEFLESEFRLTMWLHKERPRDLFFELGLNGSELGTHDFSQVESQESPYLFVTKSQWLSPVYSVKALIVLKCSPPSCDHLVVMAPNILEVQATWFVKSLT